MKEFSASNGKYLVNKVKDLISETKDEIVDKLEAVTTESSEAIKNLNTTTSDLKNTISNLDVATATEDGLMSSQMVQQINAMDDILAQVYDELQNLQESGGSDSSTLSQILGNIPISAVYKIDENFNWGNISSNNPLEIPARYLHYLIRNYAASEDMDYPIYAVPGSNPDLAIRLATLRAEPESMPVADYVSEPERAPVAESSYDSADVADYVPSAESSYDYADNAESQPVVDQPSRPVVDQADSAFDQPSGSDAESQPPAELEVDQPEIGEIIEPGAEESSRQPTDFIFLCGKTLRNNPPFDDTFILAVDISRVLEPQNKTNIRFVEVIVDDLGILISKVSLGGSSQIETPQGQVVSYTDNGYMSNQDKTILDALHKALLEDLLSEKSISLDGAMYMGNGWNKSDLDDFNGEVAGKVFYNADNAAEVLQNIIGTLCRNRESLDNVLTPVKLLNLEDVYRQSKANNKVEGEGVGLNSLDAILSKVYNDFLTTNSDYIPETVLNLTEEAIFNSLGFTMQDGVVHHLASWDSEKKQNRSYLADELPTIVLCRCGDMASDDPITGDGSGFSCVVLTPTEVEDKEMPVFFGAGKLYFNTDSSHNPSKAKFVEVQVVLDMNDGSLTIDFIRNSTDVKVQTLESNNKQYFLGNFESGADLYKEALAVGVADNPDRAILVGIAKNIDKKSDFNVIIFNEVDIQAKVCQQWTTLGGNYRCVRTVSLKTSDNGYYSAYPWQHTQAAGIYLESHTDTKIGLKLSDVTGANFGHGLAAVLPSSTSEKAGLMSAADKRKLDSNAQSVEQLVLNQNNLFSVMDDETNAKTIAQGNNIQFGSTESIRATVDAANSKVSFKVLGTREEKEDFADLRENGPMIINDVELYSGNDYSVRKSTIIWDGNNTEEDETNYWQDKSENVFAITTRINDNVYSIMDIAGSFTYFDSNGEWKRSNINWYDSPNYFEFEEAEVVEKNNCKGLKLLWKAGGDTLTRFCLEVTYMIKDN